ncbi:MAG: hypothetical protein QMB11_00330 [Nonlabens sp.]|jgi:hypothetical protein|uniref:hypothetical protein n=1 Tax=Nonlabens sp. TaxID=1888209 RepID=UPI0035A6570C
MNQQKNTVLSLYSKDRCGYFLRKVAVFESIYLIADEDENYVMIGSNNDSVIAFGQRKDLPNHS